MSSNNIKFNSRLQLGVKPPSKSKNISKQVIDPINEQKLASARQSRASDNNNFPRNEIKILLGDQDEVESGNSVLDEKSKKEFSDSNSVKDKSLDDSKSHLKSGPKRADKIEENQNSIEKEVCPSMKKDNESKKSNIKNSNSKSNVQSEEQIKLTSNNENMEHNSDNHKNAQFEESNKIMLNEGKVDGSH